MPRPPASVPVVSPVLVPALVVIALLLRALPQPVYLGVPDPAAQAAVFGVAAPFGDDLKGSSDAFLSLQAQSLLREGLAATGGVPLFNVTKAERDDFLWYDHHPPGVALVTALAFRLFGTSELVARGVALLFSTITLVAVAMAVARAAGAIPAIAAAIGLVAPPLGWYWASHLDYQVPVLAAVTVFLVAALREPATRGSRVVAGLALSAAVALDFLALLAVVSLGVARLLSPPRRLRSTILLGALAGGVALAIVAGMHVATSRHGNLLGRGLSQWVAEVWTLPENVSAGGFVAEVARHLYERLGIAPLVGLALGIGVAVAGRGPVELRRLLWAGLVFALLAGLLPRRRALDHPYFQIPWILPVAVAFALAVVALRSRLRVEPKLNDLMLGFDWKRGVPALALGLLVMSEGWYRSIVVRPEEHGLPRSDLDRPDRPVPPDDRPSAALLGRELARAVPPHVPVIALPAASLFPDFVPSFYAGRLVLRLGPDETRDGIQPTLALFGLDSAEVTLAKDPAWPGRAGLVPLPPPDPPPDPPRPK